MRTIHWTSSFLFLALGAAGCDPGADFITTAPAASALAGSCPDLVHEGDLEVFGPDEIDSVAGLTEVTGSLFVGELAGQTFDGFPACAPSAVTSRCRTASR